MGREDEGGQCEDGTDDIKDWSNRSVAECSRTGEGQATMEAAGARNDLRPVA